MTTPNPSAEQPQGAAVPPETGGSLPPLSMQPDVTPAAGQLAPEVPVAFTQTPPAPMDSEAAPAAAPAPAPAKEEGPKTLTTREAIIILRELLSKGEYLKVVSGANDILQLEPQNEDVLKLQALAQRYVENPSEAAQFQKKVQGAKTARNIAGGIIVLLVLGGLGFAGWAYFGESAQPDGTEQPSEAPLAYEVRVATNPSPARGPAPLTVNFKLRADVPDGVDVTFDTGDGVPKRAPFDHTFLQPGSYPVKATAVRASDGTVLSSATENVEVIATISAEIEATPGKGMDSLEVAFRATVDGATPPFTYSWDFGDGETDTVEAPKHRYESAGTYTVRATVRTVNGIEATAESQVTIVESEVVSGTPSSAPPSSVSSVPAGAVDAVITTIPPSADGKTLSGVAPLAVLFSAGSSKSENGKITSYSWDFGDLTGSEKPADRHRYSRPGMYKVTLEIYDESGNRGTETMTVNVKQPVATPSSAPDSPVDVSISTDVPPRGPAPLTVTFDGSGSSSKEGEITSYEWDFNDGSLLGKEAVATHRFQTPGKYRVELKVKDEKGNEASKDITVDVR